MQNLTNLENSWNMEGMPVEMVDSFITNRHPGKISSDENWELENSIPVSMQLFLEGYTAFEPDEPAEIETTRNEKLLKEFIEDIAHSNRQEEVDFENTVYSRADSGISMSESPEWKIMNNDILFGRYN